MKYPMFAIRDLKTGFLAPTCEVNESAAIRNFEHAVKSRPDSLFFTHPEDYALFRVGTFDSDSAAVWADESPVELVSASQIMYPRGDDNG